MKLQSNNLSWTPEGRFFSVEVSELRLSSLQREISIQSQRTGVIKVFALEKIEFDANHDILWWRYYNAETSCYLVIFND